MSPCNRASVQLALLGLLCGHALASGETSGKTRTVVEADGKVGMVRQQDDLNIPGTKALSVANRIPQEELTNEAQDKSGDADTTREMERDSGGNYMLREGLTRTFTSANVGSSGHAMSGASSTSASEHVAHEGNMLHRKMHGDATPISGINREGVLQGCGAICDLSDLSATIGEVRKQPVNCMGLFENTVNDAPAADWPPPESIPEQLLMDYTMNGNATHNSWYLQSRYSGAQAMTNRWTTEMLDTAMAEAGIGTLEGTYGVGETMEVSSILHQHRSAIAGKHLFVIGSEKPWLEALLLSHGAQNVTTIEYGAINSSDPRVSTMTPDEVRQMWLESNGTQPRFDGGATYSSIEHSGLGRYGDLLNPWGDLQAMAKAWCITKPDGPMFVGVPKGKHDLVHWNAHRVYGPRRYPQLMANWQLLGTGNQAVYPDGEPQAMEAFQRRD